MCCFTRPVELVERTRIYARAQGERELVVYEARLAAVGDLAMVLPLPVAEGAGQDAVSFVDLRSSPAFFRALEYAFRTEELSAQASRQPPTKGLLPVQQVGAFEASFVPTARDFDRLDPRFSLPSAFWSSVPAVRGFGFVVFKLRGEVASPGFTDRLLGRVPRAVAKDLHPMAFWFPRRDRERLFFPTLHVHDGAMHADASFDHVLYAQGGPSVPGWETSRFGFRDGMSGSGRELVLDGPGQRSTLVGRLPNRDTWIAG